MTINISRLTFSQHFIIERAARYETICRVGIGQVVKQQWYNGCWHCLTDTGVMLVIDEAGHYCMTAYFADWIEVKKFYCGNVPKAMQKRINRNISWGLTKGAYKR